MRTFCAFVLFVMSAQLFSSCQKELTADDISPLPPLPPGDSITLVKTIRTINYQEDGSFYWQNQESYDYDKVLNRTIVTYHDSSMHVDGEVEQYTDIFQYDSQNRLSQFLSTGKYNSAIKIDFSYTGSGDISRAVTQNLWLKRAIVSDFSISRQNGQTIITEYDTSGIFGPAPGSLVHDDRPRKSNYVFDEKTRLSRIQEFSTFYNQEPAMWLKDTLDTKVYYDNDGNVFKSTNGFVYYGSPDPGPPSRLLDSNLYTREGNNTAITNSIFYVYRNMFWFQVNTGGGMSNAMVNAGPVIYQFGTPVQTMSYWEFRPPEPAVTDFRTGNFQNTFDADGLLIKSIYPKNFANKYGGRAESWYTYTKIKK